MIPKEITGRSWKYCVHTLGNMLGLQGKTKASNHRRRSL